MIKLLESISSLAMLLEALIDRPEFLARLEKLGFGSSGDGYVRILSLDPTPSKKYAAWVLFQLENGTWNYSSDMDYAKDLLKRFEKAQPRLSQKDLYTYKSIDEVEDAIGQAGSSAEARKVAKAGMIKVASKNGYEIYQATTVAALMKASNHTDWCTRHEDTAKNYIKRGVRFYVVFKDGIKQGAIVFAAGKVTTYHPEQNKYKFALTDPDLEDALGFLSQEDYAKLPTMANIIKDPEKAYYYARDVIKGEWPAGEPAIASDPLYAYEYAYNILKGERFPAGDLRTRSEAVIANHPYYAYYYARDVLKGERFPAGEAVIARDPRYAYLYARDVIEGEWPAGEPALARDPYCVYYYALDVLKGERFSAGEPVLASNPRYAYLYARNVLKLPDAEAKRWGKEYLKNG